MFGFNLTPEKEKEAQEIIKQMNAASLNMAKLYLSPNSSFLIIRDGTAEAEQYKKGSLILGVIASPLSEQFLIIVG